ncbi:MAG: histidinol dehydrogenase, partial [Proteobacteria bacterium]|nr:histidinol dehydrogenase [Pseudomonadota bacterium]
MKRTIWQDLTPAEQDALLRRPALAADECLRRDVADILSQVQDDGDAALIRLARELDGVEVSDLLVSPGEFEEAESSLRSEERSAIRMAAANISAFHRAQLPQPLSVETTPGVVCERLVRPIASVGLYVPAGSAPLPSTALMLGIPASLAGCPTQVLCSPPRTDGRVDPAVLYAASVCGISTVVRAGGAQAIGAMAYGTETVPRVDKLFGRGNAWGSVAKEKFAAVPRGAA